MKSFPSTRVQRRTVYDGNRFGVLIVADTWHRSMSERLLLLFKRGAAVALCYSNSVRKGVLTVSTHLPSD